MCVHNYKLSFPLELETGKFQFNDVFGTLDLHVTRVANILYTYILKLVLISLCSYWPILGVCAQGLAWSGVGRKQAVQ